MNLRNKLTNGGYRFESETDPKTGRHLVVIVSSKKVLMAHAYGNTKIGAMLKCLRSFNSQRLPAYRLF